MYTSFSLNFKRENASLKHCYTPMPCLLSCVPCRTPYNKMCIINILQLRDFQRPNTGFKWSLSVLWCVLAALQGAVWESPRLLISMAVEIALNCRKQCQSLYMSHSKSWPIHMGLEGAFTFDECSYILPVAVVIIFCERMHDKGLINTYCPAHNCHQETLPLTWCFTPLLVLPI